MKRITKAPTLGHGLHDFNADECVAAMQEATVCERALAAIAAGTISLGSSGK